MDSAFYNAAVISAVRRGGARSSVTVPMNSVAARAARYGRGNLTLHLPRAWHREQEWLHLWDAACGPPPIAA